MTDFTQFGRLPDLVRCFILYKLAENDNNRTKTEAAIDMPLRTLRQKLAEYRKAGFPIPDSSHVPWVNRSQKPRKKAPRLEGNARWHFYADS